jgi:arginine decarboxylase
MGKKWSIEDANKTYFVDNWGAGHFTINEAGHLCSVAKKNKKESVIDIYSVIRELKSQKIQLPVVIRFQDILRDQVKALNKNFRDVIDESNYEGRFYGVYPVKVNQMREVVEEVTEVGKSYDMGLEAGSKAELMSVLSLPLSERALTVLNGYKDEDYLRLAMLGCKLGRKMVVVIEKFTELDKLIRLSKEMKVCPIIGIRAKMNIKGRGRWADSSGEKAKFGLSIPEILKLIEVLKSEDMLDSLKLFHFHIGSQITDIRTVKDAIDEGGRIYSKLFQMGVPLEYFDVGGGLGIDYDGSRSTNDSSINYNVHEYATDVVYGLKQICDLEGVPHPNIVTESGRFITAHHSCVITNVIGKVDHSFTEYPTKKVTGEHILVTNIRDLLGELTEKNYQEIYNDALSIKEQCGHAFKLGILSLEERAKIESLYWSISKRVFEIVQDKDFIPEEMQHFDDLISDLYLCNFSVFQSAADSWAIDQLLPIMPIHRLDEKPSRYASIADITCDSDGKINRFIDRDEGLKNTIPLHRLEKDKDYYLGIFLTGAYQDVMGDMHNLFGRLNEVHVYSDSEDEDGFYIEEVIRGNSAAEVLCTMQYNPDYMAYHMKKTVDKKVAQGKIQPREGVRLVDFYEECLLGYTYLRNHKPRKS